MFNCLVHLERCYNLPAILQKDRNHGVKGRRGGNYLGANQQRFFIERRKKYRRLIEEGLEHYTAQAIVLRDYNPEVEYAGAPLGEGGKWIVELLGEP